MNGDHPFRVARGLWKEHPVVARAGSVTRRAGRPVPARSPTRKQILNIKHRSAAAVFWLPLITFGIYSIVWYAKTRGDMNRSGAKAMTTWWLLVPFAYFWYLWSLSKAIEQVTGASKGANYALLLLLGWIGQTIVQARINSHVAGVAVAAPAPAAATVA